MRGERETLEMCASTIARGLVLIFEVLLGCPQGASISRSSLFPCIGPQASLLAGGQCGGRGQPWKCAPAPLHIFVLIIEVLRDVPRSLQNISVMCCPQLLVTFTVIYTLEHPPVAIWSPEPISRAMAAQSLPPPFWKDCLHSPANFQNFLCWSIYYATDAELADCELLYSIEHRSAFGSNHPLGMHFPSRRNTLDLRWCDTAGCTRCTSLKGGWKWNWVGPWTPRSCHPQPGEPVAVTWANGQLPWPMGNMRGPGKDSGLQALRAPPTGN